MENVKILQIQKILKIFFIIIFGSLLITLSAKIKIPFYPVPMTMQTFMIILIGASFGYKIGLATVSIYLFEGIIGLPVFSNSPEKGTGLVYFTGPTMGYLLGSLVLFFLLDILNITKSFFKFYKNSFFYFHNLFTRPCMVGIFNWLG